MFLLRTFRSKLLLYRRPAYLKSLSVQSSLAYRPLPILRPFSNGFSRPFSVFNPLLQSHHPRKHEDDHNNPSLRNEPTRPIKDRIYTVPNLLSLSRIGLCPILGYAILQDHSHLATSLLVYAGITDLADGYLARKFKMGSVLGTILDPAADKALMTTLVVVLTMKNMLPLPLGIIILSRDVILSLWAFYVRYTSLPPPKTLQRYWDFSISSAEVRPTTISKVNTALQLLLMSVTTVSPLLSLDISIQLQALQWTVAATTIWSGFSYLFAKDGFKIIKAASRSRKRKPPQSSPPSEP